VVVAAGFRAGFGSSRGKRRQGSCVSGAASQPASSSTGRRQQGETMCMCVAARDAQTEARAAEHSLRVCWLHAGHCCCCRLLAPWQRRC
jgi:hypothetical protein